MTTTKLNKTEKEVFNAIVDSAIKGTDGNFTYADEALDFLPNLTINQVKGYVSQLSQKGFITKYDDEQIYTGTYNEDQEWFDNSMRFKD